MLTDELLLTRAKKLIEAKLNWGESEDWTNQDFVALSEKIQEQLNIPLSHVTLKRIWGKVKYESLPNTHTLNTLVQFIGYENWREFKIKNGNGAQHGETPAIPQREIKTAPPHGGKIFKLIDVASIAILLISCIVLFCAGKKMAIEPR